MQTLFSQDVFPMEGNIQQNVFSKPGLDNPSEEILIVRQDKMDPKIGYLANLSCCPYHLISNNISTPCM